MVLNSQSFLFCIFFLKSLLPAVTSPSSLYSQETDTSHTYLLFKAQEIKLKNTHTHTNKALSNYIQVTLLVNEKKKKKA